MVLKSGLKPPSNQMTSTLQRHFALQPSARSDPVEVAVDVELQQVARRVARTPRRFRLDAPETRCREVEPVDKHVDEPNRIVGVDVIVNRLRQQQKLVPSESGDVSHAQF